MSLDDYIGEYDPDEEPLVEDSDPKQEAAPTLYYGSVDEWYREWFRIVYRRKISNRDNGGRIWAARWWQYPEADARLEALWRSWEAARLDPAAGMLAWFREADYHMSILMDDTGPFPMDRLRDDDANKAEAGDPLPYVAPPEGMYPDQR